MLQIDFLELQKFCRVRISLQFLTNVDCHSRPFREAPRTNIFMSMKAHMLLFSEYKEIALVQMLWNPICFARRFLDLLACATFYSHYLPLAHLLLAHFFTIRNPNKWVSWKRKFLCTIGSCVTHVQIVEYEFGGQWLRNSKLVVHALDSTEFIWGKAHMLKDKNLEVTDEMSSMCKSTWRSWECSHLGWVGQLWTK
jgi:hypothetical protein